MIVLEHSIFDALVEVVGGLVQAHVLSFCARRAVCRRIMAYVRLTLLSRVIRSTTIDIVGVTGIEVVFQLLSLV